MTHTSIGVDAKNDKLLFKEELAKIKPTLPKFARFLTIQKYPTIGKYKIDNVILGKSTDWDILNKLKELI